MKVSPNIKCPCTSKKKYKKCCKPFHEGSKPNTALELMRSRFCAFSLNNASYIINTTHPDNPDYTTSVNTWEIEILNFCENTSFENLVILNVDESCEESFVKFKATLKQNFEDISFIENSRFLKVENKWLYVDGIIT